MTNNGEFQPCCADPTTDAGGNPDDPPGHGIQGPPLAGPVPMVDIIEGGSSTEIDTGIAHGLSTGMKVLILGVGPGLTPTVNGSWTITVLNATAFTIPVVVTGVANPDKAYVSRIG
jgi:hypothetical protein